MTVRLDLALSTALLLLCAGLPLRAAGDYSLFFTISNDVSPAQPSTTVTMWAAFDPQWYAFAYTQTEAWSAPDPGRLSDPEVLIYQKFYCYPGDVAPDGESITHISIIQYDSILGQYAQPGTPFDIWAATWSTDDFTPRSVPIWTQTSKFYVYVDNNGTWQDFYGPDFVEAASFINVVRDLCYPDFTGDGVLDLFDFLAYVNLFNAGDDAADCDGDRALDLFDFLCYTNTFNDGC
jgi:hypothetical protein